MCNITIIIPIYNAEKYLKELLESIVHQTMDFRTIQVIMVDDHSKDNSTKIMDEYANKYDNFISIKLENLDIKIGSNYKIEFSLKPSNVDEFITTRLNQEGNIIMAVY